MTRALSSSEETNGRNGAGAGAGIYSAENNQVQPLEASEARRVVVIQGLVGSDARTNYFAMPGSTLEGWAYLERLLEPVKKFLEAGDPPWTKVLEVTEYRGMRTPPGDCAEDALPLEARNPYREAAKHQNGEQST